VNITPAQHVNANQLAFMRALSRWQGVATTSELGPQTSQADNSARQTCRRRGWVTFDRYHWRMTDAGWVALRRAEEQQ
jgi:hypothetical protein